MRRNVWKQSKENQREEQEFDDAVDQAQIQQSLRGHQNLALGNRAKKTEGESLEPDKIASGGVEISAAGTFRN